MKIVANLYENSDKFTKVANEWLAKTRLKPRIVFWLKRRFEVLLLPRFGAKKNQQNHAKDVAYALMKL